jgi:hypothetical protein
MINDHGEIVGHHGDADSFVPGNLAYWPDPKAGHQPLSVNGSHPWIGELEHLCVSGMLFFRGNEGR